MLMNFIQLAAARKTRNSSYRAHKFPTAPDCSPNPQVYTSPPAAKKNRPRAPAHSRKAQAIMQ
jgi:hypothetical protein